MEIIAKEIVFESQVLSVERTVLSDKEILFARETVRRPEAAAAVVEYEGKILLVKQYRHAAGRDLWEIPAGKLDAGEDPITAIKREVQEETGITAEIVMTIGKIMPSPGYSDEVIHLFYMPVTKIPKSYENIFIVGEIQDISFFDRKRLKIMIANNIVIDAKSIIGISLTN
ncbi:MAG: NUDIX hydrolase [Hyphomicrobiaceae bacterium]|nr:MAG: NUDIX hydrolase [Hyphomicrobiaceae bacterium]